VAFAHDGFAIINGGRGKVCVWYIEQGEELQVLHHSGELQFLCPDAVPKVI